MKEEKSSLIFGMALQCAPLFLKIKPAELFCVSSDYKKEIQDFLKGTEVSVVLLGGKKTGQVFLLYQKEKFKQMLKEADRIKLLKQMGYPAKGFRDQLTCLKERFQQYCSREGEFPHEIGIFLGYPVEDVQGFMKNQGKDYLYCGYWKVYSNVEQTKKLFDMYDRAKRIMYFIASERSTKRG